MSFPPPVNGSVVNTSQIQTLFSSRLNDRSFGEGGREINEKRENQSNNSSQSLQSSTFNLQSSISVQNQNQDPKMDEKEEKKKRVLVESLGWLTESSIMPKKQRSIEGVGPSSILELKAQLYQSQDESKKSKELNGPDVEFLRAKNKISQRDSFSLKNSGVDARALKDKLELKAASDGSASYAALEKKAELYAKLVKGELSDEEDNEKYCVDFSRKGTEQEPQQPQGSNVSSAASPDNDVHNGDGSLLFNMEFVAPGRTSGTMDNSEHKRFVREVHEEVNQAREKASELKLRRLELAEARREKLRQAYLRKLLEKQKAAPSTEQT